MSISPYFILDQPDADAVQSQQKSEVLRQNGFSFDFFSCILTKWRSNSELLSFILSGELHDIFVGLMGRRNSESGECVCGFFKTESDGFLRL